MCSGFVCVGFWLVVGVCDFVFGGHAGGWVCFVWCSVLPDFAGIMFMVVLWASWFLL